MNVGVKDIVIVSLFDIMYMLHIVEAKLFTSK